MIARRLGSAMTLLVLVASGSYLLVYLYRWEWNRAIVAGVFFVAAEVAAVGTALFRRLRAIEERLDSRPDVPARPLQRIREAAPEPRRRFDWLDPTSTKVFVPVLLGAGVILSLLGLAVERLAGATTTPWRERQLAARLGAISFPSTGFTSAAPRSGLGSLEQPRSKARPAARSTVRRAFVVAAAALLVVSALQVIANATQDRPDPTVTGGSVHISLSIHNRFTDRSPINTAEALFVACRHTLGHDHHRAGSFVDHGGGAVSFIVEPDIARHAQRRFRGCLEDAVFSRVSASVTEMDHRP
ncbi:MAG TPA: hypothetical protein VM262_01805 [Acidimicrobiales bacterium]|nr:hypothetical protein [Acidimicrobiales bacterium]